MFVKNESDIVLLHGRHISLIFCMFFGKINSIMKRSRKGKSCVLNREMSIKYNYHIYLHEKQLSRKLFR